MVDRSSKEKATKSLSTNKEVSSPHLPDKSKVDSLAPGKIPLHTNLEEHKAGTEDPRHSLERKLTKGARKKLNRKQKQEKDKETSKEAHEDSTNLIEVNVSSSSAIHTSEISEEREENAFRETGGNFPDTTATDAGPSVDSGLSIEGAEVSNSIPREEIQETTEIFQSGHEETVVVERIEESKREIVVENAEEVVGYEGVEENREAYVESEERKEEKKIYVESGDKDKNRVLASTNTVDFPAGRKTDIKIDRVEIEEKKESLLDALLTEVSVDLHSNETEESSEKMREVKFVDSYTSKEEIEDFVRIEEQSENHPQEANILIEEKKEINSEKRDSINEEMYPEPREEDKGFEESTVSEAKPEGDQQIVYDQKEDEIKIHSEIVVEVNTHASDILSKEDRDTELFAEDFNISETIACSEKLNEAETITAIEIDSEENREIETNYIEDLKVDEAEAETITAIEIDSEEKREIETNYIEDLKVDEAEAEIKIEPSTKISNIHSEEGKVIETISENKELIENIIVNHSIKGEEEEKEEERLIVPEEGTRIKEGVIDIQIEQETKYPYDESQNIESTPVESLEKSLDNLNLKHKETLSEDILVENSKETEKIVQEPTEKYSAKEIEINSEEKKEISEMPHDTQVEAKVIDIETPIDESSEYHKEIAITHEPEKSEQEVLISHKTIEHHHISGHETIPHSLAAIEETLTELNSEPIKTLPEEAKEIIIEKPQEILEVSISKEDIQVGPLEIHVSLANTSNDPPHKTVEISSKTLAQLDSSEPPLTSPQIFDLSSPTLSAHDTLDLTNPSPHISNTRSIETLEESKEIPFGDISGIGISEDSHFKRKFGTKTPSKSLEPSTTYKPSSIIKDPTDRYSSSDEETKKEIEVIQSALEFSDAANLNSKEMHTEGAFDNSRNSLFEKDSSRDNILVSNQFTEITGGSEKYSELDQAIVLENSGCDGRVSSSSSAFEDEILMKRIESQNYGYRVDEEYQEMEIFEGKEEKIKEKTPPSSDIFRSPETGMLIINKLEPPGPELELVRESEDTGKGFLGVNAISVENSSNSSLVDEDKRIKIIDFIDINVQKNDDIKEDAVVVAEKSGEREKEKETVVVTENKNIEKVTYSSETIEVMKTREENQKEHDSWKEEEGGSRAIEKEFDVKEERKGDIESSNKRIEGATEVTIVQSGSRREEEKVEPVSKSIAEETKVTPEKPTMKEDKLTDKVVPGAYHNSLASLTKDEGINKKPQQSAKSDTSCTKCLVF